MISIDRARRKLALHWGKRVLSRFVTDDEPDERDVAVMIPVALKDVARAERTIPMVRLNLAHRISRFAIVAPSHDQIRALCERLNVDFIDERVHLDPLVGPERARDTNGWIKQQLLKLIAPEIMGHDDVVVIDSDTYPIRKVAFLDSAGRQILYRGDQNATPFHRFTENLIGKTPLKHSSFVAHCMLFRQEHLDLLRQDIDRRHGREWQDVILDLVAEDDAVAGVLSEYDLYGHFLVRDRPGRFSIRYYANAKVGDDVFLNPDRIPPSKRHFRFVSNHQRGV